MVNFIQFYLRIFVISNTHHIGTLACSQQNKSLQFFLTPTSLIVSITNQIFVFPPNRNWSIKKENNEITFRKHYKMKSIVSNQRHLTLLFSIKSENNVAFVIYNRHNHKIKERKPLNSD